VYWQGEALSEGTIAALAASAALTAKGGVEAGGNVDLSESTRLTELCAGIRAGPRQSHSLACSTLQLAGSGF
jgi:hypothetical protein